MDSDKYILIFINMGTAMYNYLLPFDLNFYLLNFYL